MNILSSFTHLQVVPNLYEFLLLNTKEAFLKNVGNQTVDVPLTSSIFFYTMEVIGYTVNNILQNIFSVYEGLFIFGWTIPLTYFLCFLWGWGSEERTRVCVCVRSVPLGPSVHPSIDTSMELWSDLNARRCALTCLCLRSIKPSSGIPWLARLHKQPLSGISMVLAC